MTERMTTRFRVHEFQNNIPYIGIEYTTANLQILGKGSLTFDLRPGTTMDEAIAIANYLNTKISGIAYTSP